MSEAMPGRRERILIAAAHEAGLLRLLPLAEHLAAGDLGRLTFLLTLPKLPDLDRVARHAHRPGSELAAQFAEAHTAELRAHMEGLASPGEPRLEVRSGELFLEAIRLVEEQGFDLLLKVAERRPRPGVGRFTEAFRASTDQHLLRKCPAPVWLVEDEAIRPPKRLVAAVDLDETSAGEPRALAGLNERIRDELLAFAASGAEEIVLLHVWDAPGEGMLRRCMPADEVDRTIAAYLEDIESTRRRALEQLGETLRAAISVRGLSCQVRIRLLRGSARTVVPEAVRRDRPDLLLMGTVGRSGVPGLLIGNTAEDVLNAVEGSLFAVKPPGFACPLDLT